MRIAVALLLATAALLAAPDAEAKWKHKLADVWIDYARWCRLKDLKQPAAEAVERARAAFPEHDALAKLTEEIGAMPEGASEAAGQDKRFGKACADAAKVYDKLAGLDHAEADAARFLDYRFEAVRLDPSKSRINRIVADIKQLSGNQRTVVEAGTLLTRLRAADPEGDYDDLEVDLAKKDVVLVSGKDHPMVGFLSLPSKWRPGGSYPVLVAVEGAGCNFLGAARGFSKGRGGRDWIVLAPCSLSNTNELVPEKYPFYTEEQRAEGNRNRIEWDLAGLDALLAVVKERFGGEEKIGITGFSGGGNLCYGFLFRHPDRVRFAVPACANFAGQGLREAEPVEGGGPPVRVLTGANDPHRDYTFGNKDMPGIEPQTDAAMAAFEKFGFTNVTRTMLPGVGHSSCGKQVWDFADAFGGSG